MIKLIEVEFNQRYESEDKTMVMQRCKHRRLLWRLYENGVEIDAGQYRDDLAKDYGFELVGMPWPQS